jgi:glycosyltransferase involved in cell wall biosynthesis
MHVQIDQTKLDVSLQPAISVHGGAVRPPRILLAGKLTALTAPGSEEVQMLGLARALPAAGTAARLWRPWEESLAEADCLHLFGSLPEHLPVIAAARRHHVPVVLSTMAWYELADCLRQRQPVTRGLAACARMLGRAVCPIWPSWRRQLYQDVDLLLPNSNAEAQQLMHYFRVPAKRIHIVPNGACPQLAAADPEPFARLVGSRGFVLYQGQIEPNKNQLGFLWAMHQSDVPVVILGDVAPGSEWYLEECRRVAGPQVQFVQHVHDNQRLLASAYTACGCLVLASWFDPTGCAALEAGMSGTPLVLPEGGCAREYFGRQALYVKSYDLPGIRRAVHAALAQGRSKSLARHVHTYFSWDAAAKATREAYDSVLCRRPRPAGVP